MRYFTALLLFSAFSFALPAQAQKATPSKAKTQKAGKKMPAPHASATAKKEVGPVLTFERTRCMGNCPAYVMQVFADGRVAYEGRRGVPMPGKKDLRLPAATVANLLRQAQEAHFAQFQNRYSRNTSDLPSTVVAVRQPNGQLKTVTVEEGEPENVRVFIASLTQQFDKLAQLGGVEE